MKYKVTTRSKLGHIAITEMLKWYCYQYCSVNRAKVLSATRDYSDHKQYTNVVITDDEKYFDIEKVVDAMKADFWITECFYKVYLEEERVQSTRVDYSIMHRRAVQIGKTN